MWTSAKPWEHVASADAGSPGLVVLMSCLPIGNTKVHAGYDAGLAVEKFIVDT